MITELSEQAARHYVLDCAEHVMHIYEKWRDGDDLRTSIAAVRRYADGTATLDELRAVSNRLNAMNDKRMDCRFVIHALAWSASPVTNEKDLYNGFSFALQRCAQAMYFSAWQGQDALRKTEETWQHGHLANYKE